MSVQKTIRWAEKAMAFSFYALIYFLPISIALTESFAGSVIFFYLLKRGSMFYDQVRKRLLPWHALSFWEKAFTFFRAFKPAENVLNKPIGIFLCVVFISVVLSEIPRLSWRGYAGKTLEYAFLYFSFLECINSRKRLKTFLIVYLISFTLICVNGIFQYVTGREFIHGSIVESGRICSSLRQPNDFGAYLIIVIPVLFFLSVFYRKKANERSDFLVFTSRPAKIILFLLFTLALVCLGLTFSRGAWMAFVLSLCFIICFKPKLLLYGFLLIVTFSLIAIFNLKDRTDGTLEQIHRFKTVDKTDKWAVIEQFVQNYNNRIVYWRGAPQIIKDYPLFGAGLNTYTKVISKYKQNWGGYAHNCYLQMAAEIGLLGLTAFLGILFTLFRNSFKALKLIKDQVRWFLVFGFLTGLLAFLIHSFLDTNLYSSQLSSLMWINMGFIIVLQKESI